MNGRSYHVFNLGDVLLCERREYCSKVLNNYSILIPYLKVWVFWYNSGFSLILLGGYILCCADYVFASRMYINVSCLIIVYGFGYHCFFSNLASFFM